jgi:hypothetical protein
MSRAQESRRKRRTLAGNLQLVQLAPWLIHPGSNPICLEFVSHKLGRLFVPMALIAMLFASWFGRRCSFLNHAFYLQVLVYGLAGLGGLAGIGRQAGIWAAPWVFLALNWTALQAWMDVLRGGLNVRWRREG